MNINVPFYARGEEERRHNFGSIWGYKGHYQSCFVRSGIILRRERDTYIYMYMYMYKYTGSVEL